MTRFEPEVVCACCGEIGEHRGRRLRASCYQRHWRAGSLGQYPKVAASTPRLGRLEDYTEMRGGGASLQEAAERLQISRRTAERYEAQRKARQAVAQ